MKKAKSLVLTISFLFFGLGNLFAAPTTVQVNNSGDSVHLEFSGQKQWIYDVKKSNSSILIQVPALSESEINQLGSWSGGFIKKINIDKNGPDGSHVLIIETKNNDIEFFDYLTDQPSRLIVDLFLPENKNVKQKVDKKEAKKEKEFQNLALPEKKESRKPAAVDVLQISNQGLAGVDTTMPTNKNFVFDGADPENKRFSIADYEIKEEAIIQSKENIYLEFPMLRMPSTHLEILTSKSPVYEISPKETDENKQARLLLTLFHNKRYNVFLKTIDWFLEKYPKSEYDEIVRFMWADALFALWTEDRNPNDFDLAMLRYRQALEKYPQSPLMERTLMLMGFATLDRGDYLGTLRQFQAHLKNRPASPNRDIARLAVAEAYLKLNRYDESLNSYSEMEKDAEIKQKIAATYLKGDVSYQRKDYESAIQSYKTARERYPQAHVDYPNALYNQAEAYFWQKKYRLSLDTYREFLKEFPSHDYAGYAMTRVGELLDILGADKSRVAGAYLETSFRYGNDRSAIVARLRLLSSRMNQMKPKEVDKAVNEIQQLAKQSDLPKMEQFATLMIAEGYTNRKEYETAIDLLVKYYQQNPTTADTELLTYRIIKNINDKIHDLASTDNFIETLKTHNKYADNWLKSSPRIDTKYNVGRAFQKAGAYKESEQIFKDVLNRLYALKGTQAEKERAVIERLPSTDEVNLRLASLSTNQGKFNEAYDFIKNIKNPESLKEVDQIERVQLAAILLEKKGDLDSASRYLVELLKTWKGIPELVAEPYMSLAQLEIKQGKADDAKKSLYKIDELMEDSGKVQSFTHKKALETLGQLYLKEKNDSEALKVFEKMLAKYEGTKGLAPIRYQVGKIYFKRGEMQKANDAWSPLQTEKNSFWYNLAQEQLKNSEWQDSYKKYIKRIPAMSERK